MRILVHGLAPKTVLDLHENPPDMVPPRHSLETRDEHEGSMIFCSAARGSRNVGRWWAK